MTDTIRIEALKHPVSRHTGFVSVELSFSNTYSIGTSYGGCGLMPYALVRRIMLKSQSKSMGSIYARTYHVIT